MRVLAVLLVATLGGSRAESQQPSSRVSFLEGRPFAEVKKRARAEKRPILLDVFAEWCGPCKLMDRTTFSDPGIAAWARSSVVAARFDAEKGEGRKLAARYAVQSFPTILFLDMDGNEIDRLLGAHQAPEFREYASQILSGKSQLGLALEKVKKTWDTSTAYSILSTLSQRNDLARLRPLVQRLLSEDADLANPASLEAFVILVSMEDGQERLSAETADLIETHLPRFAVDARRPAISAALSREYARRGDVESVRRLLATTLGGRFQSDGEKSRYEAELLAAQGAAERKAGLLREAVKSFTRVLEIADRLGTHPSVRASKELDLAEALASSGKVSEARASVKSALERWGNDVGTLARAARISLATKATTEALSTARRAVELSRGEDAEAQAALAATLRASGDPVGAANAWRRAAELDPDNIEYRREAGAPKKVAARAS